MAGPTKNSEGGKKMSKNEIPKQDPKQKKGLTNALKYFFGVGDAGFVLMSNIETFYFMTSDGPGRLCSWCSWCDQFRIYHC